MLLGTALITTRTGTLPVGAASGILISSCQTPTIPAAKPEKRTSPKVFPTAAQTDGWRVRQVFPSVVGTATVLIPPSGAISPSAMEGLTGPCPVPVIFMVVPLIAGVLSPFVVPS